LHDTGKQPKLRICGFKGLFLFKKGGMMPQFHFVILSASEESRGGYEILRYRSG
jgi:hypothetical protein